MKHRIICLILSAVLCLLPLAACGGAESGQTLYVRDTGAHDAVTATFLSTGSDETKEVELKQIGSGEGYTEFSCTADPDQFDRVILSTAADETPELAFNPYISGWELNEHRFMPYTYGEEHDAPKYERVSFDYEKRTKDILIWTPEDYDPAAEEPYSVIYMTDGQNLFNPSATSTGSWAVAESALSAVNTAHSDGNSAAFGTSGFIIVGIENADGWRDNELTPDIGEVLSEDYEDGHGAYYCDFVVNTVMPYIEEHYNVYTDRAHTAVCGSSSGGIESFYIAMEHPEKFGSVGALSPAFLLYSDDTWEEYLSGRDFSEGYPFIYLYCGSSSSDQLEQALCTGARSMPDTLSKIGYPAEQIVSKYYDDGAHNEMYWRAVFPEFLSCAFPLTPAA